MEHMTELDLSYNYLATFLDHFFKFNKYIEILLLNNNRIAKLSSNALADLTDLRRLDLSNNALGHIAKGLFDSLNKLEYLNLAYNPLTKLASGTFRGLRNLLELNLSGNQFTHLTFGLMHFSPQLLTLTLDDTAIEELHNSELLGVPSLRNLSLRNNKRLREMENYVLADTPALEVLDISGNALTYLPSSVSNLTRYLPLHYRFSIQFRWRFLLTLNKFCAVQKMQATRAWKSSGKKSVSSVASRQQVSNSSHNTDVDGILLQTAPLEHLRKPMGVRLSDVLVCGVGRGAPEHHKVWTDLRPRRLPEWYAAHPSPLELHQATDCLQDAHPTVQAQSGRFVGVQVSEGNFFSYRARTNNRHNWRKEKIAFANG